MHPRASGFGRTGNKLGVQKLGVYPYGGGDLARVDVVSSELGHVHRRNAMYQRACGQPLPFSGQRRVHHERDRCRRREPGRRRRGGGRGSRCRLAGRRSSSRVGSARCQSYRDGYFVQTLWPAAFSRRTAEKYTSSNRCAKSPAWCARSQSAHLASKLTFPGETAAPTSETPSSTTRRAGITSSVRQRRARRGVAA